jgi:PEGA domain
MRTSFLAVTVAFALVSASTLATADNRGGGRSSGHSNSGGRAGSRQGSSASSSRSGHTSEHRASARDSNRGDTTRYSNRGATTRYRAGDGHGYRNSRPSYYRNRPYYGRGSYYRPGFSLYLGSPSYYDSYAYGGYYPETYAAVPYASVPYAPDYGYGGPVEDAQDVRPQSDYGDPDRGADVAGSSRLQLDVRPADATIYVDGQFRGTADHGGELQITPGRHTVEVVRPGFQTERRVVDVGIGEARSLSIALQPARR